jgi:NAD(P)-dependent dehydrogenase (short-subunit alcohol dehydrogenase family)
MMTITLITGANKGLGYETARRLIDLGHIVLAGARDPQRADRSCIVPGGAGRWPASRDCRQRA